MARLALSKKRDIGRWATLFSGWASARRKKALLVAFDADPIAAARDGNRGGVDDIADRDNDQLQEAAARGAVACVLSVGMLPSECSVTQITEPRVSRTTLDLLGTGRREGSS
jgi:hypothetical protein